MADIRSAQVLAQVEWQVPGLVKASQVIAQVEYVKTPPGEYNGNVPLALTPSSDSSSHFVYTGDVSATLTPASEYGSATTYYGSVPLTLVPSATILVSFLYTGDVSIILTPEATAIGSHAYEGSISLSLIPNSRYSVPIPGFDHWFGYGLVDLTFLDDNPPYFCIEPEIDLVLTTEGEVSFYKEYILEASGGLGIGGEGTVAFYTPSIYTVVAAGGLIASGEGIVELETPEIYTEVGSGEFIVSGEGITLFVDAEEIPEYAVIGSGGFVVSGAGGVNFVNILPTYTVIGIGGVRTAGAGTIVFVEAEVTEYSVIGSGGLKVSGLGNFAFITPDDIFTLVGSGGLSISGAGLITWLFPDYYAIIGSGGVVAGGGGTDEDFVYHTWVLSGFNRKASIYSNYGFNSYCIYKGKLYGTNNAGISILEGTADGDNIIHTGLAIGPSNFGTFNKKRIRSVFVGSRNEVDVRISMDSENIVTSCDFTARKGRAVISRKLVGEEITVNVTDFDELTAMEIIPITLGSRKSR
jgi:hypothetical protein